jgi:cytochrome c oxidase subunit 2
MRSFVFRREDGDETDGPHVHGNTKLEIGWTIVPTVVVLGFGVWGAVALNDITSPKPNEMTVNVTGKQWVWSFAYPEQGDFASSELVLPVDRTIVLKMTAEDVCTPSGCRSSASSRTWCPARDDVAHHPHRGG